MTNLGSILKSTDISWLTKVPIVKAMVFPVVIYRCESWAIKKTEHWRIVAFKLWYCRRLLGALWTARRSNQSILRKTNPEYSLEGLMLKLKLQYFGHLMQRAEFWKRSWCWKRMKAGEEVDDRGWDGSMASTTQSTWVWANFRRWWWTGKPIVHEVVKSQTWQWLNNEQQMERNLCYSFMRLINLLYKV